MAVLEGQVANLRDMMVSNWIVVAAIAFAVIAVTTRLQTAFSDDGSRGEGAKRVPKVPYWLPAIGHIPNMLYDGNTYLKSLRASYTGGAFALNFAGMTHSIVYTPSLVTALLNVKESQASNDEAGKVIGERIFGYPMRQESETYDLAVDELKRCYHFLLNESSLRVMVERTAKIVDQTISNLVSFSASVVDQSTWERTARCEVKTDKSGNTVVAANLLDLIRDYCAVASNEAVIGSDFGKNFPNYLADLWLVDRAFIYLAAGLPRWVPIPMVTRAHIARRSLLRSFEAFEEAMDKRHAGQDPGLEWNNLDDVGPVVSERIAIYRKYGLSMQARAALEFILVWATNANSNMLVFWMLNRIYADKELLSSLREEIAPYILATQPPKDLAVAEPPRLSKLDVDGLCSQCPLLKSCYVESLRVDAGTWSFKVVKEDFVLNGRDKQGQPFLVKKGEYIHAAHVVHNLDPAYFPDPELWIADRHVRVDENGKRTADLGTIRAYGKALQY